VGPQVPQQALKRTLIGLFAAPRAEVADVNLPADVRSPGFLGGHDRLVETDRKQDAAMLPALAFQARLDFVADLAALN
jgi:hypothetical protein